MACIKLVSLLSASQSANSSYYNAVQMTGTTWVSEKEVYVDKTPTYMILNTLVGGVIEATSTAISIKTVYDTAGTSSQHQPNIIFYHEV